MLEIAITAMAEGARLQREARAQAGKPPLPRVGGNGFTMLGEHLLAFLQAIPWQDDGEQDVLPEPTPDGGPYCVTCKGGRWLADRSVPGWMPALARCMDCLDTTVAARRDQLAAAAELSPAQRGKTFGAFKQAAGARDALRAAALWASRVAIDPQPDDAPWLVICGERGSGKTHLALAAANALIQTLHPVRWFHTVDLVDLARSLVSSGGAFAFRRELEAAPALVLDEFGALSTMGTDWAVTGFVEPLLDARYRNRAATLFTLKATPPEVRAHISESVGRRMEDPAVCLTVENRAPQWKGDAA